MLGAVESRLEPPVATAHALHDVGWGEAVGWSTGHRSFPVDQQLASPGRSYSAVNWP